MQSALIAVIFLAAASRVGVQAKPTLHEKLRATEARLAKVAAGHGETMKKMHEIEANLDALLKKIRESRGKLHQGKP